MQTPGRLFAAGERAAEPDAFALDGAAVHVWSARLDDDPGLPARLFGLLSPDEQARAGRFVFERDRRRFVVARGTLRQILGRCAGQPPEALRFVYGAAGKPSLAGETHIAFNLSHSGELALIAAARACDVGIDVELRHPLEDMMSLAARCFSARENAALRALPDGQRAAGFFNCWTRKEAFIKALGEGLSYPLDRFDVSLKPGEPASLLYVQDDPLAAEQWTLAAFEPAENYTAALAVRGQGWAVRRWHWAGM